MRGSSAQLVLPYISEADHGVHTAPWLTIREVARLIRVSRDTVERWVRTGQLEAVDVSRTTRPGARRASWRISSRSLAAFLDQRATRPPPPPTPSRRATRREVVDFIK